MMMGLVMKQVDYTLAFVQSELNEDVYVRMAKGFERPGHVFTNSGRVYMDCGKVL